MYKKYLGKGNPMFGKSGKLTPRYGKPLSKNRCQWFDVQGIKCQGSFERRFIEACFKHKIDHFARNTERFYLKDSKGEFTYLPDFNVQGQLIEIKGWVGPNSKRKLQAIKDNDLPVTVLFEKELIEFENTGYYNQEEIPD